MLSAEEGGGAKRWEAQAVRTRCSARRGADKERRVEETGEIEGKGQGSNGKGNAASGRRERMQGRG